jgi:hypothetical protein
MALVQAVCALGIVLLLSMAAPPACADDADSNSDTSSDTSSDTNNGQDLTKPLTRLDLRYQYQTSGQDRDQATDTFKIRVDKPFELGSGWSASLRADLPFALTNVTGASNPGGNYQFGLGDVLTQAVLIKTVSRDFAWAFGTQLIFPTASTDTMGGGKYRVVPTVGARWNPPGFGDGNWLEGIVRYDISYAGDPDRSTKRELQLQPMVNVALWQGWYFDLYPSSDIRYNAATVRSGDTGRWFVPVDFLVGDKISRKLLVSLEISVPVVKEYHVYSFKSEARVGFFF